MHLKRAFAQRQLKFARTSVLQSAVLSPRCAVCLGVLFTALLRRAAWGPGVVIRTAPTRVATLQLRGSFLRAATR